MKTGKNQTKKGKIKGFPSVVEAGLAFKHGFYLETGWILSLQFEKKAKKLLRQIENEPRPAGYSFEQCIRRMKYLYRTLPIAYGLMPFFPCPRQKLQTSNFVDQYSIFIRAASP